MSLFVDDPTASPFNQSRNQTNHDFLQRVSRAFPRLHQPRFRALPVNEAVAACKSFTKHFLLLAFGAQFFIWICFVFAKNLLTVSFVIDLSEKKPSL